MPILQRLRHLHYYLWVLAYGCGQEVGVADESGPLSLYHFPWVQAVSQLLSPSPQGEGEGWLEFGYVLTNMPFVLCTLLFIYYGGRSVSHMMVT